MVGNNTRETLRVVSGTWEITGAFKYVLTIGDEYLASSKRVIFRIV